MDRRQAPGAGAPYPNLIGKHHAATHLLVRERSALLEGGALRLALLYLLVVLRDVLRYLGHRLRVLQQQRERARSTIMEWPSKGKRLT